MDSELSLSDSDDTDNELSLNDEHDSELYDDQDSNDWLLLELHDRVDDSDAVDAVDDSDDNVEDWLDS